MTRPDSDLQAAIAVSRFGLGARPGELETARYDPQAWLGAQIRPEGGDIPQALGGGALPSCEDRFALLASCKAAQKAAGPDEALRKAAFEPLYSGFADEVMSRFWLGATTPSPFRERWALFWANHFSVSANKGQDVLAVVGAFDREAIRPHMFARFEDLLIASSQHPAMLLYLDQSQSIGPNSPAGLKRHGAGLNENLGREIMELHSLGADAGYTQADVTEFARALTGWSVARGPAAGADQFGRFEYRPNIHEPGSRTIFGHVYAPGDQSQAEAALRDFAASPHTAEHIARQLAIQFVADDPPPALVARLKRGYLDSRGDLAHVARVLIAAPEAWEPRAAKLKTPYDFLISSYRTAGIGPSDPRRDVLNPLSALGHRPYTAPQPNGWPDQAADWASPDAMVKRLSYAQSFAGAHAPMQDPVEVAQAALGARLTPATYTTIKRAETRQEAFAILLMSPEFQRR
jgi:uncharacterized protein (DUF1800 family)